MRIFLLPFAVLVSAPLAAQVTEIAPGVELPAEAEIETRVDADLNGDGITDIAYVAHTDDWRALTVLLSAQGAPDLAYRPEVLPLEQASLGPGVLALDGNVLRFDDLTGGTTAVSSIRRFRYDGRGDRMRLIGLDATLYSRTNAHDGFEASWNLLNGDAVTRELRRAEGAGEEAYKPAIERSFKRRIRAQWLSDSPDPEVFLDEMSDG
jgi:hypothetical protein